MADQMSLASIDDQLANARTQALAQGLTAEQAEAQARSVVFGDDPDAAERYDLLKSEQATSLATQDLQAEGQAITAADIAGVRESLGQTIAAGEREAADFERKKRALGIVLAEQAARRSANADLVSIHDEPIQDGTSAKEDMTAQDFADVRAGLRAGVVAADRRDAQYERRKEAVNNLARQRLADEEAEARAMVDAALNPQSTEYGQDAKPFLFDEYTEAGRETHDTNIAEKQRVIDAEAAAKAASEAKAAAEFKAQQAQQAKIDAELREAKAATDRADRLDKAAIMMMMAAQQPIGPQTIGEAMSGQYGQRQAQVAADINTARTFFQKSGTIRRDLMTDRERKRKARQAESADKTRRFLANQRQDRLDERKRLDREMKVKIAKLRDDTRYMIAEGRINALMSKLEDQSDAANERLVIEWAKYGQLKKIRNQEGGDRLLKTRFEAARNNYNSYERTMSRLSRSRNELNRVIQGKEMLGQSTLREKSQLQKIDSQMTLTETEMERAQEAMSLLQAASAREFQVGDNTGAGKPRTRKRKRSKKPWR